MKKAFNIAKSITLLSAWCVTLAYVICGRNVIAWNLFRFWCWFDFIVFVLTLTIVDDYFDKHQDAAEAALLLPRWISAIIDLVTIGALAATGRFLYASLVTVATICQSIYKDKAERSLKRKVQQ